MIQFEPLVNRLIALALEEDRVNDDCTSQLLIDQGLTCRAKLLTREECVCCEGGLLSQISKLAGFQLAIQVVATDGIWLKAGDVIAEIQGNYREVLALERTWLNFLQRTCAVATKTRRVVDKTEGALVIMDTRKTLPGWRVLDKHSTKVGGAINHRFDLASMILVKDNHRAHFKGNFKDLLEKLTEKKGLVPIEVEVETHEELQLALQYPLDAVMLDNMRNDDLEKAFDLITKQGFKGRVEISGGITEERIAALKNFRGASVSMGSLTTQATGIDLSLEMVVTS